MVPNEIEKEEQDRNKAGERILIAQCSQGPSIKPAGKLN